MKKYAICFITILTVFFTSIPTFASEIGATINYSDSIISDDALDGEIVKVLDLYSQDSNLFYDQYLNDNGISPLSVPKKVVVTSTTYTTEPSNIIAKSPIVDKGMTASVSYTETLSASFNCSGDVKVGIISAGVGFDVTGGYSTTGSASKVATHKGYLALIPRYKVVRFNVYVGSRRPIGKQTWVYMSSGTARKPENLVAIWKNTY